MKVIGITGLIGSGKGTVSDFLIEDGFVKIAFADALKDAVAKIFGWPRELLEGDTEESRTWREQPDNWWAERLQRPYFSPRVALQLMGTEASRNVFHADIWVSVLERKISNLQADGAVRGVVVPDVRFVNEIECIKRLGGTLVRVQRGPLPDHWEETSRYNKILNLLETGSEDDSEFAVRHRAWLDDNIHMSEWAWIGMDNPDFVIFNNFDLATLQKCAKQLAAED